MKTIYYRNKTNKCRKSQANYENPELRSEPIQTNVNTHKRMSTTKRLTVFQSQQAYAKYPFNTKKIQQTTNQLAIYYKKNKPINRTKKKKTIRYRIITIE